MKTTAGVTCSCTLGEWRPAPNVAVGLVRSAQMLWWLRGLFGCISVHCLSLMRKATCVSDRSITSEGKQLREKHVAHILLWKSDYCRWVERRAALLLFVIGACEDLASGICWPERQEQIHVGEQYKTKNARESSSKSVGCWRVHGRMQIQHAWCDCVNRIVMESSR